VVSNVCSHPKADDVFHEIGQFADGDTVAGIDGFLIGPALDANLHFHGCGVGGVFCETSEHNLGLSRQLRDLILEFRAWFENHHPSRFDCEFLKRLGISPRTLSLLADFKLPHSGQLDLFA